MKKSIPRSSKRGRTYLASSRKPSVSSPNDCPSTSPPHLSNVLKPISNILDSLQGRRIVVERRVVVDKIKSYDLREVVGRVGWEGILFWSANAYTSLVKNMFVSISSTNVAKNSCSFTISFTNRNDVISPEIIGSITGIPCLKWYHPCF